MAMGAWDISVNVLNIPYCTNMEILGIHFNTYLKRYADTERASVAGQISTQAKDTYLRILCMDKRIQYIHNYLLARAWYTRMAQILQIPEGCRRQIDTATT
jgi:hypothetical protein